MQTMQGPIAAMAAAPIAGDGVSGSRDCWSHASIAAVAACWARSEYNATRRPEAAAYEEYSHVSH